LEGGIGIIMAFVPISDLSVLASARQASYFRFFGIFELENKASKYGNNLHEKPLPIESFQHNVQ